MKTYVMSVKQMVLLAAFQGWDTIIGITDPFLGHLASQVQDEWSDCRKSMIEKGNLLDSEGKISLIPELVNLLAVCCEPRSFVTVTDETGKTGVTLCNKPEIGEIVVLRQTGGNVMAQVYTNETCPVEEIVLGAIIMPDTDLHFQPFSVSKNDFDSIFSNNESYNSSMFALSSGLSKEKANDLALLLRHSNRVIGLAGGIVSEPDPSFLSFTIYIGETGGVKARHYSERLNDMVELSVFTGDDIQAIIGMLVRN